MNPFMLYENFPFQRYRVIISGRRICKVTLKKLELQQETLKNLIQKPEGKPAFCTLASDVTGINTCPTNCGTCKPCPH